MIRPKPKRSRVLWRTGRIILDGRGMQQLRWEAFGRSGRRCENLITVGKWKEGKLRQRCQNPISWITAHLHHIISRAHGGSDSLENTMMTCPECHRKHHDRKRLIVPPIREIVA